MNKTTKVEADIAGKNIRFETGLLAQQAAGSVTLQLGDTVVFSAVTTGKPREGIDFFPLQVEYREKAYAAGRFPGGYFKRESRPSEKEILVARMTDRPIRALFPDGYRNEVQINNSMLCADGENESDILCINAASAALTLSEIPFMGPIGAVRVGRVDGQFVVNPTHTQIATSDLNLIYVGTRDMMMMIEGSAQEVSEKDMIAAMKVAHESVVKLVDAQIQLRKALGLPDKVIADLPQPELLPKAREIAGAELTEALLIGGKLERQNKVTEIKESLKAKLVEQDPELDDKKFGSVFDALEIETVRKNVLEKGKRIGGRGFDELRPLAGQVGLLPRTHGSALFNRGETQALATITLGTMSDVQSMDALAGGPDEKSFMLHYNFPPYSVGEVGRLGAVGRREIGHGSLAERSLLPVMPKDYPYTVRVVSEIMGSNGSSSMASICAGTLALMDAGIPIVKPVAGISIGLFTGKDKAILVTDILGAEDHCGDMDFKVAGTRDGITGFQVDLKIRGLSWELVEGAFEQAKVARAKILDFMSTVLPAPRADLSEFAPRITVLKINPEKIGALIGPGGKNIRRITDTLGVQIDIEDDGSVHVFSTDKKAMEAAVYEVSLITAVPEPGKLYRGTVTGIKEFGAFVEILPGQDGLVHISELADFRVNRVEDVCKVGDQMWVKCINVEDNGKIRLSRKAALAEKDKNPEQQQP
ncbi:MAG TPA: polyribonucleotide nucleotidyltransferase [Kiritimatiellia bacterium]|nr:polyribonucleotide nucleotidyltransferase [Kiritimatiellia bacterium]